VSSDAPVPDDETPGAPEAPSRDAESPARITADELALRLGISRGQVERLADAGVIDRDVDGRFAPGDVHRIRLVNAFEETGTPLDALIAASGAGRISLRYYDELHPAPGELSGRTYAEFGASLGRMREHLTRLFAAFGLAEPDPDSRLPAADEALIAAVLDIVVATGQPDLGLRAVRTLGEGARRAADGALGLYGEAVGREDDFDLQGLPVDALFEQLLRPWARFVQLSSPLAGWLTSRHLSRAIDEYSIVETERVLETDGYVAARLASPPAVAFVDLTGFTRLTEERGDEVAAGIALRLGEVTADVVAPFGGRVVKLLGDGVLVRFDGAAAAVEATLTLLAGLPAADLPSGHAGVAAGPLIVREGDVFGRTVNMAARISDVAPDGSLYVPDSVAAALPVGPFGTRSVASPLLQGIGQVDLVEVFRTGRVLDA
jgi:adenylate cyclase